MPAAFFYRLPRLVRYYGVGLINTAFGFALFSLLVHLGLQMYLAQLVAHLTGMAFNYFTYSRHVFQDRGPARARFAISYLVNYVIGLTLLLLISLVVSNPYLAGFLSILLTSLINYGMLKYGVFRRQSAT